jgi:hypothetical protein
VGAHVLAALTHQGVAELAVHGLTDGGAQQQVGLQLERVAALIHQQPEHLLGRGGVEQAAGGVPHVDRGAVLAERRLAGVVAHDAGLHQLEDGARAAVVDGGGEQHRAPFHAGGHPVLGQLDAHPSAGATLQQAAAADLCVRAHDLAGQVDQPRAVRVVNEPLARHAQHALAQVALALIPADPREHAGHLHVGLLVATEHQRALLDREVDQLDGPLQRHLQLEGVGVVGDACAVPGGAALGREADEGVALQVGDVFHGHFGWLLQWWARSPGLVPGAGAVLPAPPI